MLPTYKNVVRMARYWLPITRVARNVSTYRKKSMNTETTDINFNYSLVEEDNSHFLYHYFKFSEQIPSDFLISSFRYDYSTSIYDATQAIVSMIETAFRGRDIRTRINYFYCGPNFYIDVFENENLVLKLLTKEYPKKNQKNIFYKQTNEYLEMMVCGAADNVKMLFDTIKEGPKSASVKWCYTSGGRFTYKSMDIKPNKTFYDEAYPWIIDKYGSVNEFFNKYISASANVLIMLGPPGTGKSSLLRELITTNNLEVTITYDEFLMNSDEMYMDFIQSDSGILVMEDADVLIKSREQTNNKIMSKLLNISDGLIQSNKKIIFTANLDYADFNQTDHALVRPGRCFDVINFRELSYDEAHVVAKKFDISSIDMKKSDTISLAKITNPLYAEESNHVKGKQKVGFI